MNSSPTYSAWKSECLKSCAVLIAQRTICPAWVISLASGRHLYIISVYELYPLRLFLKGTGIKKAATSDRLVSLYRALRLARLQERRN